MFYADAISLLINATKTVGCTEPFKQITRTHFRKNKVSKKTTTELPPPLNRSFTIESCSAEASCHVLIEQSEEQRNPLVGLAHIEDFESLPDSDDIHAGE